MSKRNSISSGKQEVTEEGRVNKNFATKKCSHNRDAFQGWEQACSL